jgi:hypothetical protein
MTTSKISRRDSLFLMGSSAALAASAGFNVSCAKGQAPEVKPSVTRQGAAEVVAD